jgi:hypothetical protein
MDDKVHLVRIEVLGAVGGLLENLTRAVTEKLVICNLELECAGVPCVIEGNVVRVNECQLLVWKSNQRLRVTNEFSRWSNVLGDLAARIFCGEEFVLGGQ